MFRAIGGSLFGRATAAGGSRVFRFGSTSDGAISIRSVFEAGQVRHATKKAGGSSSNGRTSQPKNMGIKAGNGTRVTPGRIIVRQRGTEWHEGPGVGRGRDHTLYAVATGRVVFRYDVLRQRRVVTVSATQGTPLPATSRDTQGRSVAGKGEGEPERAGETDIEAPLVATASRAETKRRLAAAVDPARYLQLSHVERRQYILDLAKQLHQEEETKKLDALKRRLMQPKRQLFTHVDLSLI
ncbi:hypothetical protein HK100_008561 [Physocladia obscura]|uniref:Large ribosomal subunit protein bL27m n=1 Tax=Physocladia obscura TaxID=109957 RepID=A0AAD5SP19_9FUNG|nr:hypothetical protein HK100_008561 [Physocladia obscura]